MFGEGRQIPEKAVRTVTRCYFYICVCLTYFAGVLRSSLSDRHGRVYTYVNMIHVHSVFVDNYEVPILHTLSYLTDFMVLCIFKIYECLCWQEGMTVLILSIYKYLLWLITIEHNKLQMSFRSIFPVGFTILTVAEIEGNIEVIVPTLPWFADFWYFEMDVNCR